MVDLKETLKESRRLIDLDKTNVKGYLRTGRTLEKMERYDLAIKFYERGLRYVPSEDSQYQLLKKMHDRAQILLTPAKKIDPLKVLPFEIIEMIFKYIPFHKTCQCLRISRHWKKLLTDNRRNWTALDFSQGSKLVSYKALISYLIYSRYQVRQVNLKGVNQKNVKMLEVLSTKCKSWSALEMLNSGAIQLDHLKAMSASKSLAQIVLSKSSRISHDNVLKLLQLCPSLTHISCENVILPQPMDRRERDAHQSQNSPRCPNLESLDFTFGEAEPRVYPRSSYTMPELLPRIGSSLKILRLRQRNEARSQHRMLILEYLLHATTLKELLIDGFITDDLSVLKQRSGSNELSYDQILNIPPSTQTLTLIKAQCFPYQTIQSTLSGIAGPGSPVLPSLRHLHILEAKGVQDLAQVQYWLQSSGPQITMLEKFNINLWFFTAEELLTVIREPRLRDLKELSLVGCQNLEDTVARAISEALGELRMLDVSRTNISGVGIKDCIQKLKRLEFIAANDCHKLNVDAVDWARKRGIKIQYCFAS